MVLEPCSSRLNRPRNCWMVDVLAVPGPPTSCRWAGWRARQEGRQGAAPEWGALAKLLAAGRRCRCAWSPASCPPAAAAAPSHQRGLAHRVHQAQQVLVAHRVQGGDDQLRKLGALHARRVLPGRDALAPVLPPPAALLHQELVKRVARQHLRAGEQVRVWVWVGRVRQWAAAWLSGVSCECVWGRQAPPPRSPPRPTSTHLVGRLVGHAPQLRVKALAVGGVQQAAQAPGGAIQEQALVVVGRHVAAAAAAAGAARAGGAGQRLEHARQQREQGGHLAHLLVVHDGAQLQAHKVEQRPHVLVEAGAQRGGLALRPCLWGRQGGGGLWRGCARAGRVGAVRWACWQGLAFRHRRCQGWRPWRVTPTRTIPPRAHLQPGGHHGLPAQLAV